MKGWPDSPLLAAVGQTLDQCRECAVYEDGAVWPAPDLIPEVYAGVLEGVSGSGAPQEGSEAGSDRPATGQGKGTAGGRTAKGTASPGPRSSVVRDLARAIEVGGYGGTASNPDAVLAAVHQSYPSSTVTQTIDGFMIATRIRPIADIAIRAVVSTTFPVDPGARVRARAWWDDGIRIGPRHVNFDGTICAFEATDGDWKRGMPISRLLDLQSIWVARQQYLRAYGRWPGRQHFSSVVERVAEQLPGELCGCGSPRLYVDCCRIKDRFARVSVEAVEQYRRAKLRRIGIAA